MHRVLHFFQVGNHVLSIHVLAKYPLDARNECIQIGFARLDLPQHHIVYAPRFERSTAKFSAIVGANVRRQAMVTRDLLKDARKPRCV